MANISALGGGPISFADKNGTQYSIPLCFVSYAAASGTPGVAAGWAGWSKAGAEQAAIGTWLGIQGALGFLLPAPVPPALPAFTVTAAAAGSMGNDITIAFNAQNTDGSLNVTVSTTQLYAGLNVISGDPRNIAAVLGLAAGGGTEPGLAYVSTAPTVMPAATPGAVNFTSAGGGAPYEFDIPNGGVLTASHEPASPDAGNITATIGNVQSAAFDLTLSWSKTVPSVTPADLAGGNFGYLINVAAPASGFAIPAVPSSVTLVGGTDTTSTAAAAAGATVISS